MNRFILVLLLVVVSGFGCLAQHIYTPDFSIGFKGGMTFSNMQFSPSVKQTMVSGKMIGITARYTEEKIFGVIMEINLEQRGWKEDFEEQKHLFDYQRRLTYVQIPMLTHIRFGSRKFKGYVNLGPSVGYMLSDKISSNFDYSNPGQVEGFPIRNRTTEQMKMDVSNKFDYGISGGIGAEFFINRRNSIQLEGRYYFGLGNIFPDRKKDFFSASRGTSIQVSLGYMFRVK